MYKSLLRYLNRFSLRKRSIGLVSVGLGVLCIGLSNPVQADMFSSSEDGLVDKTKMLTIEYRLLEDLTAHEKILVETSLSYTVSEDDDTIVLVYRPQVSHSVKEQEFFPKTNSTKSSSLFALTGGVLLLIAVSGLTKGKSRSILKSFLVTGTGISLLGMQAVALENSVFQDSQLLQARVGEVLEFSKGLDGYDYYGYLRVNSQERMSSDKVVEKTKKVPVQDMRSDDEAVSELAVSAYSGVVDRLESEPVVIEKPQEVGFTLGAVSPILDEEVPVVLSSLEEVVTDESVSPDSTTSSVPSVSGASDDGTSIFSPTGGAGITSSADTPESSETNNVVSSTEEVISEKSSSSEATAVSPK